MDCINLFCQVSRQRVNVAKSRILFSKFSNRESCSEVSKLTNIPVTSELGRYLGFQLFGDGRGNQNFKEVLNKMNNRLASWKAKMLSMAGHVTLIKFVLNSIPLYSMQLIRFPLKECNSIDKLS